MYIYICIYIYIYIYINGCQLKIGERQLLVCYCHDNKIHHLMSVHEMVNHVQSVKDYFSREPFTGAFHHTATKS